MTLADKVASSLARREDMGSPTPFGSPRRVPTSSPWTSARTSCPFLLPRHRGGTDGDRQAR